MTFEFDVIHYQAPFYPMSIAFTRLIKTPMVHTLHQQPFPEQVRLWRRYAEANFVAISEYQRSALEGLNCAATIHHGLNIGSFTFSNKPQDYLAFLGRFTPGKGVLQAIEIARRTGERLLMAAPEDDYYHRYVKPHVDGRQIEYLGELDHAGKVELLGGAYATAPQGLYSNLIALLAKSGLETHLWGIPPEQFGVPAEEITDTIDIAPFLDRKLAALRCHRTQYDASHAFLHLSSELGAQIFSHEYFRRIW